jgi:RNase P subunit RPR2
MALPDSRASYRRSTMSEKTCAACDYPLDDSAIQVRVGGQTVEVCCEDCAVKLREAHASATAAQQA